LSAIHFNGWSDLVDIRFNGNSCRQWKSLFTFIKYEPFWYRKNPPPQKGKKNMKIRRVARLGLKWLLARVLATVLE